MEKALLKVITTFDGTKAIKGNCRYIKGEYYEKNRQCFMMSDNKWHRINNGKICFEHKTQSWMFSNHPGIVEGIIGGTPEDIKFGFLLSDVEQDVQVVMDRVKYQLLDPSLIEKLDLIEDIGSGMFMRRKDCTISPSKNYIGKKKTYSYPIKLEYNSKNQLDYYINQHTLYRNNKFLSFFTEELGKASFGIEFEVWNGTVPFRMLKQLGLIPLLDGSLRHDEIISYEYATIPLSGGTGLRSIVNSCEVLQKYTDISPYCSLHVHIGGYEPSKPFINSLYKVAKAVEKDMYNLFPHDYKDTSTFKQKNYCGVLPSFKTEDNNLLFNQIYKWLSNGETFNQFDYNEHPSDPSGNHKWDVGSRYHWLNLVPFLWGTARTIEFRVHPPTTNAIKVINWIFICNAILKYAEEYKETPENLFDVINTVYSRHLSSYLNNYITKLKLDRIRFDENRDMTGVLWCKEDEKFTFPMANMLTRNF